MNNNGSWDNVVDSHSLGFSANNDSLYSSHNVGQKKAIIDDNVRHFKEYILIVY